MKFGWIYDESSLEHDVGRCHPEQADRLRAVVHALEEAGLTQRMTRIPALEASREDLCLIHTPEYIDRVRKACEQGQGYVDSHECPVSSQTYQAAARAAGGVLAACDAVMAGQIRRAFCALRPPGHHAEPDEAKGFCIFNSIAIGAECLIRRHHLERVAIVDIDVHHGNGTQHAFDERDDVLFISLHEDPRRLFPGSGFDYETGRGRGEGFTLNIPMDAGAGDQDYRLAMREKVLPRLEAFEPQFLLLSTGFDALRDDPLADINLTHCMYVQMTEELCDVADRFCCGRLISVLEGGYELRGLARGAVDHVRVLMGLED